MVVQLINNCNTIDYTSLFQLSKYYINTFLVQKGVDFFYHCLVARVAAENIAYNRIFLVLGQQLLIAVKLIAAKYGTTDGELICGNLQRN